MCDTLVALAPATAAGVTLFAKNSDRPPDETQILEWLPARRDRGPTRATFIDIESSRTDTYGCVVTRPTWCWGAEMGVNQAGVAIGNEAIYTTLDPRRFAPALIGMDLVRLGLERAGSATAAVDVVTSLLGRYGQGGSGHDPNGASGAKAYWSSFLIADPLEAFVVETSGRQWEADRVNDVRAISNRTTIESFDRTHRHPRQPVEMYVDARLQASNELLSRRPVTVDALEEHLRSHDAAAVDGWSVCMHAKDDRGREVEVTTASMIAELAADGKHRARIALGAPCRVAYREFVVGAPLPSS
jgi:secernin